MWRHDLFHSGGELGASRRERLGDHAGESCPDSRGEWTHDFFDGEISSCPGSTVFVRGLPAGVRETDLRTKLEACGTIVAVKVRADQVHRNAVVSKRSIKVFIFS